MKKSVHLATLLIALLPFSMTAATKTWTGKISDSMCAATHKMVKEHEQKGEISKTAGNVINHRKASKSERMPV